MSLSVSSVSLSLCLCLSLCLLSHPLSPLSLISIELAVQIDDLRKQLKEVSQIDKNPMTALYACSSSPPLPPPIINHYLVYNYVGMSLNIQKCY